MTEAQRCAECDCENGGLECNWFKPGPNATSTKSEDVEALDTALAGVEYALEDQDLTIKAGVVRTSRATLRALLAERDALREAAMKLHDDMLERARYGMDVIHGEQYRIVNAGNGAWQGFCAALGTNQDEEAA